MKTPAQYIREYVFGCWSQQAFADVLGVTQPTVCRWERDCLGLSRDGMDRILELARVKAIPFDERWFFRVPDCLETGTYRDSAA